VILKLKIKIPPTPNIRGVFDSGLFVGGVSGQFAVLNPQTVRPEASGQTVRHCRTAL